MPEKWQQFYPHYIDSWLGSDKVNELSDAAYKAVHTLICRQWQQPDGTLPEDDKELARMSRKREVWATIREEVMEHFPRVGPGRVANVRLLKEWHRAFEIHEGRVKGGKKSVRRAGSDSSAIAELKLTPPHIQVQVHKQIQKTKDKTFAAPLPDASGIRDSSQDGDDRKKAKERHMEFKTILDEYWKAKNSIEMPWDGSEGKALSQLLAANPKFDETAFRACLRNRFRSELNHAERPRAWLARVTDFAAGPLDQFKNLKREEKHGSNQDNRGAAVGRVQRSADAFRAAARRSAEASTWGVSSESGGDVAGTRGTPGHGGNVSIGDGGTGDGVRASAGRSSAAKVLDPDEILPPSKRNSRGAGIHGRESKAGRTEE